jgi:hypothetical protein
MKKESVKTIWIVTVYAIAMGLLEAAVVVYLRYLYYPDGFAFPLKGFIDPAVLGVEWAREFATIVMLVTIGMLAAPKKSWFTKFAYFIYAFAIWDIFYYVFLKLFLGWPASLLTMDILFMIPWPWAGPVLAPLLCTVVMIALALFAIEQEDRGRKMRLGVLDITLILLGVAVILYTWLVDYWQVIFEGGFGKEFFSLATNAQFTAAIDAYVPPPYRWGWFAVGFIVALTGIALFCRRAIREKK